MKFKRLFAALFCVFLLSLSAFAGDIEWLLTHNAHDALIVGEVTDIEDGVATIKVAHQIISQLPEGVQRQQLSPSEIKIKSDYICFGFVNDNYRENKVGDDVVMNVNKNGDLWELSAASYLVDSIDFKTLNILLPAALAEDSKNTAAAHTLYIKSFINADGASVPEETTFQNAVEIKSTVKDSNFVYFTTAKPSELAPEKEAAAPSLPKPDYTRLYIVTGCGILFVALMLIYRKIK